jgi:uncharacterized protein YbjT (DUF2867 family)
VILLAGGTGAVGRRLAVELKIRRLPFRALTRDRARARDVLGPADFVPGDFDRPETFPAALSGVRAVFLASPLDPRLPARETAFLRAAKKAGVERVVLLSVLGAAPRARFAAGRWHGEAEEEFRALGFAGAVLRPAPLHQNLLESAAAILSGVFPAALGDAAAPMVDAGDVAAAAAAALAGDLPPGDYDLAGPALTGAEIAATLSRVLERAVSYAAVAEADARAAMERAGLPDWLVSARLEQAAYARSGAAPAGTDLRRACGREPAALERFVRENAAAFR